MQPAHYYCQWLTLRGQEAFSEFWEVLIDSTKLCATRPTRTCAGRSHFRGNVIYLSVHQGQKKKATGTDWKRVHNRGQLHELCDTRRSAIWVSYPLFKEEDDNNSWNTVKSLNGRGMWSPEGCYPIIRYHEADKKPHTIHHTNHVPGMKRRIIR